MQLDFIGPITETNRRFYILLAMDRFSKWPAASFCTSTDGGKIWRFSQETLHQVKLRDSVYPYTHRSGKTGVRTLKENLLTNSKVWERFGKALNVSGRNEQNATCTTEKVRLRTPLRQETKHGD